MPDTKKIYTNLEIAEFLTNIATAYEIKNKSYFRIVSYQNAADSVISYPKSIQEIWQTDRKALDNLPSIGPNIMKKLDYLFEYHKYPPSVKKAFSNIHPAVFTFTKINGIGPKIAHTLTQKLKFSRKPLRSLNQLIKYAQNGKIRDLPRLGQKSEESILENTLFFLGQHRRLDLKEANEIAQKIIDYMKQAFPEVEFVPLGSLRRQSPSVGDIDIAAKSDQTEKILSHFILYPDNIQTISKGPKKASIRIYHDIRVDLMVQPKESFGSLIQHFTGSKNHNILLRKHALNLGYSVSEYGIKEIKTGNIHNFENEKDVYNFLKLAYIEPHDRVGENEIETAQKWYNKNN